MSAVQSNKCFLWKDSHSIWVLARLQQSIEAFIMHLSLLLGPQLVHLCLGCQASLRLINMMLQVHSSLLLPFTLLVL